jgi:hypothetical protein
VQYEQDLNKARDEIQKAQQEMKNIDSEVGNFHQKMAKSMHSLLKAFTEGFEAMDKAKADELVEIKQRRNKRNQKRMKKMEKISTGISSLQELTSKLKMSFDDKKDEQRQLDSENLMTSDLNLTSVAQTNSTLISAGQTNHSTNTSHHSAPLNLSKPAVSIKTIAAVAKKTA